MLLGGQVEVGRDGKTCSTDNMGGQSGCDVAADSETDGDKRDIQKTPNGDCLEVSSYVDTVGRENSSI